MESESSSVLPWHWVIEALAGFKEITLPTLQALIDASPLTHDDFSETTKDLIALKCLEELYPSSTTTTTTTLEDDSRAQLDSSLSSHDVLLQILHQVPLSNLRTAGPELSKWDVNRFMAHKRAHNVKCQLEKLKESILDGTLPLNDHLKERSGLFQTGKCDGNSTYAEEDTGEKENSASLILEDGNQSLKERLPDNNCLSSKRNRVYSANEDQVCMNECDGSLEDIHNRGTASNLGHSSGQNEDFLDESGIPFNVTSTHQQKTSGSKPRSEHEPDLHLKGSNGSQKTVSSDKSQDDAGIDCGIQISGDTAVYQGENLNLVRKKRRKESLDKKCNKRGQLLVSEATSIPILAPESCIAMKTNDTVHVEPIPTNDGNADKVQHMTNESQPKQKEPNVASLNRSQKPVASDKAVVDTVNDCGAELSSDSDVYYNDRIDLTAKKDEFLSSQHASGQDLPAMTESRGQNLCSKCNEAGQLLVCRTTTCSLMLHENCLGDSAQLDAKGNFLCPFCGYSHAISEYLEAKKLSSLARKELAIFISKGSTGN